ncbi:MAG: hypothetical protein ACE364_05180 [Chlorobiota bacterium]
MLRIIKLLIYISLINLLLFSCSLYNNGFDSLSPISNHEEYYNEYYPLELGVRKDYLKIEIGEVTNKPKQWRSEKIIKFGMFELTIASKLQKVPVYKMQINFYVGDDMIDEKYQYIIPMKEGIVFTDVIGPYLTIEIERFVPTSKKYLSVLKRLGFDAMYGSNISENLEEGEFLEVKKEIDVYGITKTRSYIYKKDFGLSSDKSLLNGIPIESSKFIKTK